MKTFDLMNNSVKGESACILVFWNEQNENTNFAAKCQRKFSVQI